MTTDPDTFESVEVESAADLWAWLDVAHVRDSAVWLVTYKARCPDKYVSREAVLDALIAYGWIDGRRMKLDDSRTMQLISPRRQKAWAKSYRERASRLEAEGRMKPAGAYAIAKAKANGLYVAGEDVDALVTPTDLQDALRTANACSWWEASAPSYRRNVLRWVDSARRPETRRKRVTEIAVRAGRAEKVPHY